MEVHFLDKAVASAFDDVRVKLAGANLRFAGCGRCTISQPNSYPQKVTAGSVFVNICKSRSLDSHSYSVHWCIGRKRFRRTFSHQEMSDSPTMLFRNYRELVTEQQAKEWFSLFPKNLRELNRPPKDPVQLTDSPATAATTYEPH
jgi:hypothetical protein